MAGEGEITDQELRDLNAWLESGLGEDASDEQIEELTRKVLGSAAGKAMLQDFAEKLQEGGVLDEMIRQSDELEVETLMAGDSLVFRAELAGISPGVWREFSIPQDATFHHLHLALQDAFGWAGAADHRFEIYEGGELELTFSDEAADDESEVYDERQNKVIELFREGIVSFSYVYGGQSQWRHEVGVQRVISTPADSKVAMLAGRGLVPPEELESPVDFADFLAGKGDIAEFCGADLVAKIREGDFDPDSVRFRLNR